MAQALDDAGHWAEVFDREWRYVYMTRDMRLSMGGLVEPATVPMGEHAFGARAAEIRQSWLNGPRERGAMRPFFAAIGGWVLSDTPGGRDALRELVDPDLRDVVDELPDADGRPAISHAGPGTGLRTQSVIVQLTAVRVHDASGAIAGTVVLLKPQAGMAVLATVAAAGDLGHFERMQTVARAARRPAAILFADLESSSALSRRLSTAGYFRLGRRLVRAADDCVVDAGGIVGRHVGDGITAFFLADHAGSESAAARACIAAARALRRALTDVADRSELEPGDIVLRFGLHWGATLYVGQILTRGRAEVTALGDEVNEAARIEACATGGRALASKALVERLDPDDAAAVGLDPDRISYVALANLPTATEKARRDAPAVAVCEV